MLTENKSLELSDNVFEGGMRAIHQDGIKYLEGKLLTLIEGIGLPLTQQEAVKQMLREILWPTLVEGTISISDKDYEALKKKHRKAEKELNERLEN